METLLILTRNVELGQSLKEKLTPDETESVLLHTSKNIETEIVSRETRKKVFACVVEDTEKREEILQQIQSAQEKTRREIVVVLIYDPTKQTTENREAMDKTIQNMNYKILALSSPVNISELHTWLSEFTEHKQPATI